MEDKNSIINGLLLDLQKAKYNHDDKTSRKIRRELRARGFFLRGNNPGDNLKHYETKGYSTLAGIVKKAMGNQYTPEPIKPPVTGKPKVNPVINPVVVKSANPLAG